MVVLLIVCSTPTAQISPCGLAMLYNPTRTVQQMTLKLPLYYTGLSEIAKIREGEGEPKQVQNRPELQC